MSDGFLSRWSRRKQALARGEELPAPEPVVEAAPETPPQPQPQPQPPAVAEPPPPVTAAEPEPELDLSSLPDVETLDAATDIRAFFQKGVPEALRNAALRKAYATDPVISTYMSPLDYAWDFNTPGGLPYGFASELGEVGEKLRQLIAQAVGEAPPAPDNAAPAGDSPGEAAPAAQMAAPGATPVATLGATPGAAVADSGPPGPGLALAEAVLEPPPPASPLRLGGEPLTLTAPAPAAPAIAEKAGEEPPLTAPRRRHGGALPV